MNVLDFQPFPALIERHAEATPDKTAFVCGASRVSWADFSARVRKVTAWLFEQSAGERPTVATLLSEPLEFLEVMMGTLGAGGVIVPLPRHFGSRPLRGIVQDCGARILVVDDHLAGGVQPVPASVVPARAIQSLERFPSVRAPALTAHDEFSIVYSSGTTSAPKGTVHSHGARFFAAARDVAYFALDAETVTLIATPLYMSMTWLLICV